MTAIIHVNIVDDAGEPWNTMNITKFTSTISNNEKE